MEFVEDASFWNAALSGSAEIDFLDPEVERLSAMTIFTLKVNDKLVWFQVTMYMRSEGHLVSVKGNGLRRSEQERWQRIIKEKELELEGAEYVCASVSFASALLSNELRFPLYNLLSKLVPMLHDAPLEDDSASLSNEVHEPTVAPDDPVFHCLFTSHHLISTKKRKSLQQWSASLRLAGFAKVGYPGAIYAQGTQGNLEEFVANVKAMQWLALKVRFVERVPAEFLSNSAPFCGWQEFSRIGEVVEEMKRLGREKFALEMGIGSSGSSN